MILLVLRPERSCRTDARRRSDYSNMSLPIELQRFSLRPIASIVAAFVLVMTVLQALPEPLQDLLRYDREAILAGEMYRLVTGHFVHLGWQHYALNMAGLVLGTWLFGPDRHPLEWTLAGILLALACGSGLLAFSPDVLWCVGLSGVLHGFMILGFGGWALAGDRLALALLVIVIVKMTWEQLGGAMPWEAALSGGRVVTDAHVWGAAGGGIFLAVASALRLRQRPL
ncbi:MAG: rhombosortase [Gammaproteobacteria bacterium]|nr:rhombosortase [Gammaproteobacteria bacterium]